MRYKIDNQKKESAYMQLYYQLRDDITRGVYKFGDKLPSKRLLSDEVGISVITAEHTYAILCDEGYVEARQRSGYFVIYNESDCFAAISPRHMAIPPLPHLPDNEFPFSVFSKTTRRVISEYGVRIFEKSENIGLKQLRYAICGYLARSRGIEVEPNQIIIGAGAEYLYSLIAQTLGKDLVFAIENPSYDKIRRVYGAVGAKIKVLEMGSDGISSYALAHTSADVLHVTPFNSYPSGITATASKRREYLKWAQINNAIIIEDDFSSEFSVSSKTEDTLFSLCPNSCIYLNTFSKTIAPSMRMGYMVIPKPLLPVFSERAGFYSCTVSTFEQIILSEIISSGDFERHINRVRRNFRKQSNPRSATEHTNK